MYTINLSLYPSKKQAYLSCRSDSSCIYNFVWLVFNDWPVNGSSNSVLEDDPLEPTR